MNVKGAVKRLFRGSVKIIYNLLANPVIRSIDMNGTLALNGGEKVSTLNRTSNKCLLILLLTMVSAQLSIEIVDAYDFGAGVDKFDDISLLTGLIAFVIGCIGASKPKHSLIYILLFALIQGASAGLYACYDALTDEGYFCAYTSCCYFTCLSAIGLFRFTNILKRSLKFVIPVVTLFSIGFVFFIDWIFDGTDLMILDNIDAATVAWCSFFCLICTVNVTLDFFKFKSFISRGIPKYYEYFLALAILFTFLWMLFEIINALSAYVKAWSYEHEKSSGSGS